MTARPSRILFACPQTVFDVSNGASMQVYSMLQEFSRRGIEAALFCGGVFDDPAGAARIPNLAEQFKENQGKAVLINKDSSANPENPITHWFFTGFHSTVWNEMTHEEETNFLNKYTEVLRTFKPDLVIGYGCDALCRSMWMEARSFGIPTAYIICNGNHHHYRFPLHDIVLCDSKATAKLYKDEDGLTVHPFGNFINPNIVVAKQRNPQTVTFINPAFAKGVAVVARLILMANKERPDISFMVVETRKKFADALRALKKPGSEVGSAFQNQTFKNIALRDATYNVSEIYATTKVLLAPSLCYESWGRVATEATMNGIPVLASKSGGLPEAVGTGGITLEKPASNQGPDENWLVLPSEEECRPWADALYDLYDHTEKWTRGGGAQRLRQKRREEFAQKDGRPVAQASQAASQKAGRRQRLYASGVRALRRGSARLGKLQVACPQETHHQQKVSRTVTSCLSQRTLCPLHCFSPHHFPKPVKHNASPALCRLSVPPALLP